jgi:hypothetical protein
MGVYDKNRSQGSRLTSHVEAYIPFEKFLLFTNKVICGEYKEEQRKCTDKYHTFFSIYGGKVDNKKGTVISRSFSLVNNPDGCSFNFVGTEGAGVKKSNGMIEPVRGVKPTASISIKMNEDELKEMVLICKTYIEQYIGITLSNKLSNTAKRWNTNE